MPGGNRDRDRPQRGGGGRSSRNDDRETSISKNLSYVLRHGAKSLGLAMDEKGFVVVSELLAHNRFRSLKVTFPDLQGVVASNAKQRFELVLRPRDIADDSPADDSNETQDASSKNTALSDRYLSNPANYLIRATQGHSIKGLDAEALLTPVLPSDADFPAEIVHGTYPAAWKLILQSGGLKPMGRTHVHFAAGLPDGKTKTKTVASSTVVESIASIKATDSVEGEGQGEEETAGVQATPDAAPVISGMRASASLLVWVDVKRSIEQGGVKWWRSKNGVVLTEGLLREGEKEGLLSVDYVSRVVERKSGNVIWKNEWWDDGQQIA